MIFVLMASYGNDSVALIQWAREKALAPVVVLYHDTGWAHPDWIARVRAGEAWVRSLGFAAETTYSEGMEALVERKRGWPRQGIQFCTTELKIKPSLAWLEKNDPERAAICMVGVRREESAKRANFPEWSANSPNHGGRKVWAPLVAHTTAARDELLSRANVFPLPFRSRECWPCVNENRSGLKELEEPTVAKIEAIETKLGCTKEGKPRVMFRPYQHMDATGIRQIVQWANSPRGKFDPDDGTGHECDTGYCGT